MAISQTIPHIPILSFSLPQNPKPLGFHPHQKMIDKQPCSSSILDRFRTLLNDREEKLRISDEEDDVSEVYEIVLSELTVNSNPVITELTMIAAERKDHAEGIANAICNQILEVPTKQKLPSLYLLDSIAKNVGLEYIKYFSLRLPEVFCDTYRQFQPSQHCAMHHLFQTWSTVFPSPLLRIIGAELRLSPLVNHQSSSSASSESPSHGIHVNPKYLEGRHQYEHVTVEARRVSSNLQKHVQQPHLGHDEYDSHCIGVTNNQVGIQRLASTENAGYASLGKSSPSRVVSDESFSPSGDRFETDSSPRRVAEKASLSQSWSQHGLSSLNQIDMERSGCRAKPSMDINNHYTETSNFHHLSHGYDLQRPRALIEAYGKHREEDNLNEKPLMVECLDVNVRNSALGTGSWQKAEEEYVWEDMSPTLPDSNKVSNLLKPKLPHGDICITIGSGELAGVHSEPNMRMGNWERQSQLPAVDDSAVIFDDEIPNSGGGIMGGVSLFGIGIRSVATRTQGSNYFQDPRNLEPDFSQSLQPHNLRVRGKSFQTFSPLSGTVLSADQRISSLIANVGPSIESAEFEKHLRKRARSPPVAPHIWPAVNLHESHPSQSLPILPEQKQIQDLSSLLDTNKPLICQGPNDSSIFAKQQFTAFESKTSSSTKLLHLPHQLGGLTSLNNQNQGQVAPHVLKSQEGQRPIPTVQAPILSHLETQPFNHGYPLQGHSPLLNPLLLNRVSPVPSVPIHNMSTPSFQLQGGAFPPPPDGHHHSIISSQVETLSQDTIPHNSQLSSQNTGLVASHSPSQNLGPIASSSALSGLFSSLVAQGLISLPTPVSVQEQIGVEFNADRLKVRHESAIKALYADLPGQCTTCGLRFKCQEEHRIHMDWHVTKNRTSKNRKQKQSRNWFVGANIWLSSAEAIGSDAAPGFLSTETVMEKKDDEEMAVPADENQNACALCGDFFDDFYSHDTEEWMYRGAVYLNYPDVSTQCMDRSQLGPIVHAKCRPGYPTISSEDCGLSEGLPCRLC